MFKASYRKMSGGAAHANYLQREGAELTQEHVSYLERDRAGQGNSRPEALDLNTGRPVNAAEKMQTWERAHDSYHWRFVVTPERTPADMDRFVRDTFADVQQQLGTKMEGFYVLHGGDHPHAHVVARGRHENGHNLFIDKEFVKHGFRDIAQQHLTHEFGERSLREIELGKERSWELRMEREHGLERVREMSERLELSREDRLSLEHTVSKGSPQQIELTMRKLDSLERLHDLDRQYTLDRDLKHDMGRNIFDSSIRNIKQTERSLDRMDAWMKEQQERQHAREHELKQCDRQPKQEHTLNRGRERGHSRGWELEL
jgi:type IV secretory pathway VirD2 relaxase